MKSNVIAHVFGKKDTHAHKKWHMTHLSSKHVFKMKHMWKIPFRQCKYNSNGSTKRFNCFWYVFLFSLLETRYFEIELFDLWYWHENQFNYKTDGDLVWRVDWQRNPDTLDHEFSKHDNWPSVFISLILKLSKFDCSLTLSEDVCVWNILLRARASRWPTPLVAARELVCEALVAQLVGQLVRLAEDLVLHSIYASGVHEKRFIITHSFQATRKIRVD